MSNYYVFRINYSDKFELIRNELINLSLSKWKNTLIQENSFD